jgi:hypothetical protein
MRDLPLMSSLAKIILCIPASSSFIERFYSICGVVCSKRNGNMTGELVGERAFLKANMKLVTFLESF